MPKSAANEFRLARARNHVVAILAYDGVNAFELGIAAEIFGLLNMGPGWYRVIICADRPGQPLTTGSFVKIVADAGLSSLRQAGTIIVPGWQDIDATPLHALLEALGRAHARGTRIASICSGVFVVAAAGLLAGRRVAAHWANAEHLARKYPQLSVDPNVLYVDDGDILSSAGRAAGLDLCVHIVRRDFGPEVANEVARRLVIPAHREGGQAQFILPGRGGRRSTRRIAQLGKRAFGSKPYHRRPGCEGSDEQADLYPAFRGGDRRFTR
jgi:AraC family transcriptional regulator, transcriptional activator FtrA